jgi:hypothetical protein
LINESSSGHKIRCSERQRQRLYGFKNRKPRRPVRLSANLRLKLKSFKYQRRLEPNVERWL